MPEIRRSASSTSKQGVPLTRPSVSRLLKIRVTRGQSTPMARSSSVCAKTSCGSPCSAISPWLSTSTRLQYSESRATFCSTTTMVIPSARFASRSVSKTNVELAGSSAAVGSSRTKTRGRMARMAAMATFCFCPPESVAISRSRRSLMPTVSSVSLTRCSIWSWGTPKFSRPKSISSSTIEATICVSISCSTLPTICDTSVSETSQVSWPSTMTDPKNAPV